MPTMNAGLVAPLAPLVVGPTARPNLALAPTAAPVVAQMAFVALASPPPLAQYAGAPTMAIVTPPSLGLVRHLLRLPLQLLQ
jgi:hypothetical protein